MLTWIRRGIWVVLATVLAAFLHYTLPDRDVVYITNTSNRLMTFGANSIFWASRPSGSLMRQTIAYAVTLAPGVSVASIAKLS